ncbi:S8 family serine peptidase [Geobacter pickeringii]|uniref:S8 family serine peptidase n=1 Tax=Geobacter pickeringii TaxID=345632 RepID=UPI000A9EDDE7|nr:S8 family serine peptidase [Geobacter pickeringii]
MPAASNLCHPSGASSTLRTAILLMALGLILAPFAAHAGSAAALRQKLPREVISRLEAGEAQTLIVHFDDTAIEEELDARRRQLGISRDDDEALSIRQSRYHSLKERALARFRRGDGEVFRDFSHLPMAVLKVRSAAALDRLSAQPEVTAVYEDRPIHLHLAESLPLIRQPQAAAIGMTGTGSTVAVIDTGVDYTRAAFGSCTAPGVPAGCKVVSSVDIATPSALPDSNGHGSNVAGITVGTAPGAKIASLNVFNPDGSSNSSLLISAINWAIANRSAYGITAINMSLGDGTKNTTACGNSALNPFVTPLANARAAGIIPVASAGNDGYLNALERPACTPGVVSVGAVYDSNLGTQAWTTCTDTVTAADKVVCFSNSASFLTMLAPGAVITAAGSSYAGTSQASPFVAGAVAVLRAAFPAETLDRTVSRLTTSGVPITDSRNGIVTPRLDLLASIGAPANDLFSQPFILTGNSGQATGSNYNATKETGEPNHAGNPGGASVWWSWNAPITGRATINTHGSSFDTLLAVYTGSSVGSLTTIAANDNDGTPGGTSSVSFIAQAGTTYRIAVDGAGGATGTINLAWNLAPEADLSVTLSCTPLAITVGDTLSCTATIANNGPSAASSPTVTVTLPSGAAFLSASSGCSYASGAVTCSVTTLASGGSTLFTINSRPAAAGTATTSATVTSATTDPVPSNNSATTSTQVAAAPTQPVPALPLQAVPLLALMVALLRKSGRWSR